MTSKSLVSLTKKKNTFSKIIWNKKFGEQEWVSAMFQIEAIGKEEKITSVTSPGNKANSSQRTRGLFILKYICCICWNGGNNEMGLSWENLSAEARMNHTLQGWTTLGLLCDKSWTSNAKTYWLEILLSLSVKLMHYFSFYTWELSVNRELCLRLVWITSRWQIPSRDNYSVVERLVW